MIAPYCLFPSGLIHANFDEEPVIPQLPSGRHVSIVSDSIFELIRMGNWGANLQLSSDVKAPEDLAALINVIYYNAADEDGELGKPYFSGFMLSDIEPIIISA